MKILELCLSPGKGGLELYVYRTAAALKAQDEIIGVLNHNSGIRKEMESLNIPLHYLNPPSVKKLPLKTAKQLAAFVDEQQVDVIHCHWANDLPLAAFAKWLSRSKPRLVFTRQMVITRPKKDLYHRFIYGQMDLMITITRSLAEAAQGFLPNPDKVVPLYYGVAPPDHILTAEERNQQRAAWGVGSDELLVSVFGRLEEFKGQHLMVEAVARNIKNGYPLKLLIVGHAMNSAYPELLKEQIQTLGIADSVIFEGFTDTPQRWMQACDILALTTIEETFGLVLPEAMRCGVAVIGSDRGGVPEIIDHEKTGLLFESGSVDSLTLQLQRLISDSAFRSALAVAGAEVASERFDLENHYRQLRKLLSGESGS